MLLRAHDPFSGHVDQAALAFPEPLPTVTVTFTDTVAERVQAALADLDVTVPAIEPVPEPPVTTQPAKATRKRATRRRRATKAEVADAVKRMDQ